MILSVGYPRCLGLRNGSRKVALAHRSNNITSMRHMAAGVAAPDKQQGAHLDRDQREMARLESADAFAELVDMNYPKKQSVNRPQKVSTMVSHCNSPMFEGSAADLYFLSSAVDL
jgi:hypothetical protein